MIKIKAKQTKEIKQLMQTYKIKIYNSQYSFVKFNDVSKFKELLLDSIPKDKMIFHKKFTMLKMSTNKK